MNCSGKKEKNKHIEKVCCFNAIVFIDCGSYWVSFYENCSNAAGLHFTKIMINLVKGLVRHVKTEMRIM